MSNEAVLINDNYVTPDKYEYYMKPIRVKRWWIFTRIDHYEPTLKLKERKISINISGDESSNDKWLRIRTLAKRNYPIILYETDSSTFEPVRIVREYEEEEDAERDEN